jgi:hypothetical protein
LIFGYFQSSESNIKLKYSYLSVTAIPFVKHLNFLFLYLSPDEKG